MNKNGQRPWLSGARGVFLVAGATAVLATILINSPDRDSATPLGYGLFVVATIAIVWVANRR